MTDAMTRPYAGPVVSMVCDRCDNIFDAAAIMPLCWPCQRAADLWARPITTAEIVSAAKHVRRQHLLHEPQRRNSPQRWWWPA